MRCVCYLNLWQIQFSFIFDIFLFKMTSVLCSSSDLDLFGTFTDASVKKKICQWLLLSHSLFMIAVHLIISRQASKNWEDVAAMQQFPKSLLSALVHF